MFGKRKEFRGGLIVPHFYIVFRNSFHQRNLLLVTWFSFFSQLFYLSLFVTSAMLIVVEGSDQFNENIYTEPL